MDPQKELKNLFDETQDKLAEGISAIIRSIDDKEQRLEVLLKNNPSTDIVKRIHAVAVEREDYETCDAVKEFAKIKEIDL